MIVQPLSLLLGSEAAHSFARRGTLPFGIILATDMQVGWVSDCSHVLIAGVKWPERCLLLTADV